MSSASEAHADDLELAELKLLGADDAGQQVLPCAVLDVSQERRGHLLA